MLAAFALSFISTNDKYIFFSNHFQQHQQVPRQSNDEENDEIEGAKDE